jgi:hypothetical protein
VTFVTFLPEGSDFYHRRRRVPLLLFRLLFNWNFIDGKYFLPLSMTRQI